MLTFSGNAAVETLEAHVLARAYRDLWRMQYGDEPAGLHVLASLDLVIDFGSAAASQPWTFDGLPSTQRPH